jgi:hypothetical protein
MALAPAVREALIEALQDAFTHQSLTEKLRFHLGLRLDRIVQGAGFTEIVTRLVDHLDMLGEARALVRTMDESVPRNGKVRAFIATYPDYPPYLTEAEREDVRVGLASVFKTLAVLQTFLQDRLSIDLSKIADIGSADAAPYLEFLVRWADHQGRIEALVQAALQGYQDPVLQAKAMPLVQRMSARRPQGAVPQGDPYAACYLEGKLMIDREPLRKAVKKLVREQNPRVLSVRGAVQSGKSHTFYYLEHISGKERNFEIITVDLKDEPSAEFRPNMLIRSILRLMGRNQSVIAIPKPEDSASPARWVKDLAEYLVGEIKSSQKTWLIVLDGFADPDLDPNTRDLVRQLVGRAAKEQLLRVALLDSADDLLPPDVAGRLADETIESFTRDHLRAFFKSFALTIGGQTATPELEQKLDVIVDDIWGTQAQGVDGHNAQLASRALTWVAKLGGGG